MHNVPFILNSTNSLHGFYNKLAKIVFRADLFWDFTNYVQ